MSICPLNQLRCDYKLLLDIQHADHSFHRGHSVNSMLFSLTANYSHDAHE